jgi:hypothetical protein
VTKCTQCPQVATGPAAEVEDGERRLAADVPQQRRDVLRDVVILRAGAKLLGVLPVVSQRAARGLIGLAAILR